MRVCVCVCVCVLLCQGFIDLILGNRYGPGVMPWIRGPGVPRSLHFTLITSLAILVSSEVFLFERTHKYPVDNQGLSPWRLRCVGESNVRSDSLVRCVLGSNLQARGKPWSLTIWITHDRHTYDGRQTESERQSKDWQPLAGPLGQSGNQQFPSSSLKAVTSTFSFWIHSGKFWNLGISNKLWDIQCWRKKSQMDFFAPFRTVLGVAKGFFGNV